MENNVFRNPKTRKWHYKITFNSITKTSEEFNSKREAENAYSRAVNRQIKFENTITNDIDYKIDDYQFMDINEFCTRLRIGKTKAYQLIHSKQIPYVKIGGSYRIRKKDFIKWINIQMIC